MTRNSNKHTYICTNIHPQFNLQGCHQSKQGLRKKNTNTTIHLPSHYKTFVYVCVFILLLFKRYNRANFLRDNLHFKKALRLLIVQVVTKSTDEDMMRGRNNEEYCIL